MSTNIQANTTLGDLVSYRINNFKMEPGGYPSGPHAERSAIEEVLTSYGMEKYGTTARGKQDALRCAMRELKDARLMVEIEGVQYLANFIMKNVRGMLNVDIQLVDQEGKQTRYLKFAKVKINDRRTDGNEDVLVSYQEDARNFQYPQEVWNFFTNIEMRITWFQNHMIDDDIRKVVKNAIADMNVIFVRPGVFFMRPHYEDSIVNLDGMLRNVVRGGEARFSIYQLPDTPITRETLVSDITSSIAEERDRLIGHINRRNELVQEMYQVTDDSDRRELNNDINEVTGVINNTAATIVAQVTEVADILPPENEVVVCATEIQGRLVMNEHGEFVFV